ncbi:hypothetical protein QYE76_053245 [Lolium multiflorum]|uniref:RNase H type-1 domain-containing protein n=1 Tax=Lolium multiflorum TaxID=4521 RepID=A0AAD8SVF1_LOLMU|nr:hypothetical protein QYE76_053245 [Lolium multiflorum]
MKYALRMTFPNASNNEVEYEALIHGMKMAKACGATRLKIFGDSQLVAQHVMNKCDTVNDSIIAYKEVYNELEKLFDGCEVNHISRLSNDEADVLANIGSQCLPIPPGVFWEEISERSTKAKKIPKQPKKKEKSKKDSGAPTGPEANTSEDEEEPEEVMMIQLPWMQMTEGARRGNGEEERWGRVTRNTGGATLLCEATASFASFSSPHPRPENLSHGGYLTEGYSRLCGGGEHRERKTSGRESAGEPSGGKSAAIAIVIERDIISIIIITISTIYTAITTAAPVTAVTIRVKS